MRTEASRASDRTTARRLPGRRLPAVAFFLIPVACVASCTAGPRWRGTAERLATGLRRSECRRPGPRTKSRRSKPRPLRNAYAIRFLETPLVSANLATLKLDCPSSSRAARACSSVQCCHRRRPSAVFDSVSMSTSPMRVAGVEGEQKDVSRGGDTPILHGAGVAAAKRRVDFICRVAWPHRDARIR
jgi:hypothetical protein